MFRAARATSRAATVAILTLFAFIAGGVASGTSVALEWRVEPVTIVTASGRHEFRAEIADKPELRGHGLMFRSYLDEDQAMLFDFEEDRPLAMWMKNTYIPLDMLFIASDGTVINIAKWTTPHSLESIESAGPARAVIEVNAGTADRLRIRPGDKVLHRIFGNR